MTDKDILFQKAREAAKNAYCPYSHFKVGAAILAASGNIFTGCNVENSSFGLTCCAERNAVGEAIKAGERSFKCIAVYLDHDEELFPPCGACRQVLSEFSPTMQVYFFNNTVSRSSSLEDLLPGHFRLEKKEEKH